MIRYFGADGRYGGEVADPVDAGDGVATMLGFLERQRATFAWKCGGLDSNGLQVKVGNSSMSLGGMLKHLARFEDDMSTEWLRGEPQVSPWNTVEWEAEHDWDWRTAASETPGELYGRWQDAVNRSRQRFAEVIDGNEPRAIDLPGVPYILLNMIEEYARHNGHADLIREAVDGLVGHDPPN